MRSYGVRRRRPRFNSRRKNAKSWIPRVFVGAVIVLLIWTIFSLFQFLFSGERSSDERAELSISKGKVEVLVTESDSWAPSMTGANFFAGDTIRTTNNTKASLEILGANTIILDKNTELVLNKIESKGSGRKEIVLTLNEGQAWAKVSSDDFSRDSKSSFVIESPFITTRVTGTAFNIQSGPLQDSVRLLKGSADIILKSGEMVSDPIALGIGQKIIGSNKTFESVGNGEDVLERVEDEFMKSDWNIDNYEKFYPQDAASIRRKIEVEAEREAALKRREEKKSEDAPVEESTLETNSNISAPTFTTPLEGAIIPASQDSLSIEGTAPDQAYQIIVNGYTLTKYQAGAKKWQYFASNKYGTIVNGKNTYSVYAVTRSGQKSPTSTINITYEGGSSAPTSEIIPSAEAPVTANPVPTTQGTTDFPAPFVTRPAIFQISPNEIYQTSASVITFSGTVDPKTQSIEVNGFRLKKFNPGDTNFAYIANANYGNMKQGENIYTIKAFGPDGAVSQTAIKIVYTPLDVQ